MRLIVTALLAQAALFGTITPMVAQQQDIVGTAKGAGQFATLLAAVEAAGLTETLRGKGPFTVFAPTDEAFRKLPAGTVETLLKPENREQLQAILLYHVVAGKVPASAARTLRTAETVGGPALAIRTEGSGLRINMASVIKADVEASNGIIHVIDEVLLPPAQSGDAAMPTERSGADRAAAARDLVDLAIRRGAPLYNAGQPEATTAIYEVAARGVLALGDGVPNDARRALERGLRSAAHEGDRAEQAWVLRRALDRAGESLDGATMRVARRH